MIKEARSGDIGCFDQTKTKQKTKMFRRDVRKV